MNLRRQGGVGEVGRVLILNTLAPVFLLIAIGTGLQASGFLSAGFLKEANRVTYWLGLPALLFTQLVGSLHGAGGATGMLGGMLLATGGVIAVGYLVAGMMGVGEGVAGTFVQGAFRGNLAFVGLPIIYAMPDVTVVGGISLRAAAVLTVAPMMVVYNVAGVMVLLLSQHRLGWAMLRPFLRQLATTPPLIASLAGIAFALLGWQLPVAVNRAFISLGEMALPLGLLGVGGSLVTVKFGGAWRAPLAAALLKTAVAPALGWVAGRWLGLGAVELKTMMIFLATPSAVISYTMAVQMKGDEMLASGAIVLSTLTSVVTLAVIVGVF
ncbi:MAG: AEC family transporter [Undibacterium sp.]|nr:AEC family transporter [Opitutaceae bacterium]